MTDVYNKALQKLQRIIAREGDADGARLKPAYFCNFCRGKYGWKNAKGSSGQ